MAVAKEGVLSTAFKEPCLRTEFICEPVVVVVVVVVVAVAIVVVAAAANQLMALPSCCRQSVR
jgi:hypothetical protein